ncbi:hypothetical protein LXL04_013630 [Taraxacum kok-saghyz]
MSKLCGSKVHASKPYGSIEVVPMGWSNSQGQVLSDSQMLDQTCKLHQIIGISYEYAHVTDYLIKTKCIYTSRQVTKCNKIKRYAIKGWLKSVFASEKVASGCELEELQADGEDARERRDGEVAKNRLRTMGVAAATSDKLGFLGTIVSMDDFLYKWKHNRMQISMNNLHRKLKLGEAAACITVKEAKRHASVYRHALPSTTPETVVLRERGQIAEFLHKLTT